MCGAQCWEERLDGVHNGRVGLKAGPPRRALPPTAADTLVEHDVVVVAYHEGDVERWHRHGRPVRNEAGAIRLNFAFGNADQNA